MADRRAFYRGVPFTLDVPETATDEQVTRFLQSRIDKDPTIFQRQVQRHGLSEDDVASLARADNKIMAEAGEVGPLDRLGMGIIRGSQKLWNGVGQLMHSPALARAAAASMATETMQPELAAVSPEAQQGLRQVQQEIGAKEAEQRRLFEALDSSPGLFGSTLGLEDIGEVLPEAAAIYMAPGSGVLANATAATLVAGMEGRTDEESRLEAMAWSGALGTALPGVAKGLERFVGAAATEMGARTLTALAGTMAGLRGFGRMTNWLQKVGGIARKETRNEALAGEARQIFEEVGAKLRPIMENLGARQRKVAAAEDMRQGLLNLFQRSLAPEIKGGGANPSTLLRGIPEDDILGLMGYKDTRWGSVLGPKWREQLVDLRNLSQELAPALGRISRDPAMRELASVGWVRGIINGTVDFVVGGTWDTIKRMNNPSARTIALERQLWKVMNSTIATMPDPVQRQQAIEARNRALPNMKEEDENEQP